MVMARSAGQQSYECEHGDLYRMVDISDNTKWNEADASNNAAPPAGFPENQLPSTVNDAARAVMGAVKRFYDHANATVVSGGSANVQTLTYTVAPTAYVAGDHYAFIVGGGLTPTGATTINVNGLGAKNVLIGTGALVGGEMQAGQVALVYYDGTSFQLIGARRLPAETSASLANPSATIDTTGVMMGFGATVTIAPTTSGIIRAWVTGNAQNGTVGDRCGMVIRFGTGSAPANGAALTGSTIGQGVVTTSTASGDSVGFSLVGRATGLTLGTTYWVDVALSSGGGGSASIANVSALVLERG